MDGLAAAFCNSRQIAFARGTPSSRRFTSSIPLRCHQFQHLLSLAILSLLVFCFTQAITSPRTPSCSARTIGEERRNCEFQRSDIRVSLGEVRQPAIEPGNPHTPGRGEKQAIRIPEGSE